MEKQYSFNSVCSLLSCMNLHKNIAKDTNNFLGAFLCIAARIGRNATLKIVKKIVLICAI